jgi:hypothetical protein
MVLDWVGTALPEPFILLRALRVAHNDTQRNTEEYQQSGPKQGLRCHP